METTWHGIFDLSPDDSIEVRAGDLQEFLRQQMMGVVNPGLTVEVRDGQPAPAKSYDERVAEAIRDPGRDRQLQRLRQEAGWRVSDMADQLNIPLRKYESYEKGESPIPRDDAYLIASRLGASPAAVPADLYDYEEQETFCTIRWMRDDIVGAIEQACGVVLDRDSADSEEVEAIIDRVIDEVSRGLQDRSTEEGWEIIDALMPDDAIERAKALAERKPERIDERNVARTSVIRALGDAGWIVRGNDAGDLFRLVYQNPATDREFAVVLDMRERDMADPAAWHEAAERAIADESVLWRGGLRKDEFTYVKADIDHFKEDMRRHLPEVIDRAVAQAGILPVNATVRNWYMHAFPEDELGSRISPKLTFDAALEAVSRGSGFYDALGVGDSVVRERVFEEMAERNGLSYEDIYSSWLDGKPVQDRSGGVSLKGEAEASRQASEQLADRGSADDRSVDKDGR